MPLRHFLESTALTPKEAEQLNVAYVTALRQLD
jgi:hypothetical protein